jgi:uncharacterized membrane protein
MTEAPLTLASLARALGKGRRTARQAGAVGIAYAGIFALFGAIMIAGLIKMGMTPFVLAAAGAFMLVGPITLAGFFGIARAVEIGRRPTADDLFNGFHHPPAALWALALVCTLLLIIFVTDAGILYSYMIGGTPLLPADMLAPPATATRFLFWTTLSGVAVGFLIFTISAFSVPLLCERRSHLVGAVVISVRLVFGNFAIMMLWAIFIAVATIVSIVLLPLFPLVMPTLAYASHALYREALPLAV